MSNIREIIENCPEGTRVSFLYPCIEGHSAETIVSLDELRALVAEYPSLGIPATEGCVIVD